MRIFKKNTFFVTVFVAIVVASIAFAFSGCNEEKSVPESSHLTVTKKLTAAQKNEKTDTDSSWYRRGKPIPGFNGGNEASRDRIRRNTDVIVDFEQQNPIVMNYPSCVQFGVICAPRGSVKIPSVKDIDLKNENRTAPDIIKIIRQRAPGLRHIYNKHLKKNPGLEGQITLKFTIVPNGEISDISIVSSTTQNQKFDAEIQQNVSRWIFPKIKSGNATVTIPFTFKE